MESRRGIANERARPGEGENSSVLPQCMEPRERRTREEAARRPRRRRESEETEFKSHCDSIADTRGCKGAASCLGPAYPQEPPPEGGRSSGHYEAAAWHVLVRESPVSGHQGRQLRGGEPSSYGCGRPWTAPSRAEKRGIEGEALNLLRSFQRRPLQTFKNLPSLPNFNL